VISVVQGPPEGSQQSTTTLRSPTRFHALNQVQTLFEIIGALEDVLHCSIDTSIVDKTDRVAPAAERLFDAIQKLVDVRSFVEDR
jgi:hypothetical protein